MKDQTKTATRHNGLFSDEEYLLIIKMAVTGRPQTREQLHRVMQECDRTRLAQAMLETILDGSVSMYVGEDDNLMVKRIKN